MYLVKMPIISRSPPTILEIFVAKVNWQSTQNLKTIQMSCTKNLLRFLVVVVSYHCAKS